MDVPYLHLLHRIALPILCILLVALVLELVRRGLLKERYALLWLGISVAGLIVGLFPFIIVWTARLLRLQYVTLMFCVAFLFLLGLVLSFTIVISRLAEQNRKLTQEVALLAQRLGRVEPRAEKDDK